MSRPLSDGYLEPEALAKLKNAYDEVVGQDWFDATPAMKDEFARYVIETVPGDEMDEAKIRQIIELSARMFYARDA
jgi:hypothetical protein